MEESILKNFNPEKTTRLISIFLKQELKKRNFNKVIVSLSGGLDSSVVISLMVKAIGRENVLTVKLPYKEVNKDQDADLIINQLGIPKENVFEIEISRIVEVFMTILGDYYPRAEKSENEELDKLRLGNIMARIRMIILYDLAKKSQALVFGTENKSEYLLGYFTRFGDEAADLEPLKNLYKTQVIALAKYLEVPQQIINKAPSAGLWFGQTDEAELGFSYQKADPILFLRFDKNYSWEEIERKGFDKELVKKVKDRVERNWFKHELPVVCKTEQ